MRLRALPKAFRIGLALALLCAVPAFAQTTSATLTGRIRSQQGSAIADASVHARSLSNGAVRSVLSGADGRYRFEILPPGAWAVWVEMADGVTSDVRNVTLGLKQTVNVDFTVGSVATEKVEVRAEAPIVDTSRTGGELRIGGRRTQELPIEGRVITNLALLDSTVQATQPGGFYGERGSVFVINGQTGRSNSFLIDGLDNNDLTSGTTNNAFFSPLVIREFVVLTRQYNAEFGRASGGVLDVITERGENDPSASFFAEGVAQGVSPAGSFVASLPSKAGSQDTTGRYSTGFSLGGPFRKDRAFYFGAYEHQESREVVPFTGVDRHLTTGGVMIAPNHDDNFFFRTDFNLSPGQTLMTRVSFDDRKSFGLNVGGRITPEAGFHLDEKDFQLATSLTSVLSASLVNEARVQFSTSGFDQAANSSRPGVERPSGVFGGNNLNRQNRAETRVQVVDTLTWEAGRHTPKVGVDVMTSRTGIDVKFNPSGNFIYDSDRPFEPGDCGDLNPSQVDPNAPGYPFNPIPCPGMVGVDDDGDGVIDEPGLIGTYPVVYQLINGRPRATLHDTRAALFAQDTWRVGSKLVLDYGLRYDVSTFTLPASSTVASSVPNGGAGVDRNNVAPRFGFAWTPDDAANWVVRGGAGIFYDKIVLGFPAVAAITSGTEIGLLFPQGFTFEITEDVVEQVGVKALKQGLIFPKELILRFSTAPQLDTPYTEQYTLGTERAVGLHGAFSANLTRALGYHTPLLRDLNPPIGTLPSGFPNHVADPNVGSIAAIVTEGRSWYTGLDLGWKWSGARTWYSATYTFSKAIDLGPDPLKGGISLPPNSNDIPGERGRSDSDRRHRFVLFGAAGLPWLGLRVSGSVSLSSGAPFDVTTGKDDNLDGITSDRPKGIGRNTGAGTNLGPVNALRRANGLAPIRTLNEPTFAQVDLKLARPFLFRTGKGSGEMYVQIYNLLDRFNGGPVEGAVLSDNFGKPVGLAGPPRTVEVGLRLGYDPSAGGRTSP